MIKTISLIAVIALGISSTFADTKPFHGKPYAIPGKIEAEHWDKGKAGVAYHDIDPQNRGENYREETQVDIEKRPDASNGHGIGWTKRGEWLIYTVSIEETGSYSVTMPVASKKKGGRFHFEIDGKDVSGAIHVPDTGSWQQLKVITHKGVKLKKGVHQMKLCLDEEGDSKSIGDIDYFLFEKEE